MSSKISLTEGSVYQRSSDSRWIAAIQDGVKENGKPKMVYLTGKEKRDVVKKLKDYKKKMLLGTSQDSEEGVSVGEYINEWMVDVKGVELKPSSYDRLESTIRTNVIPLIGHIPLNNLTSKDIQSLVINHLYEKGLSFSSIKKCYDAINSCCKYAIINRHLIYNPCLTVKLPTKHKFENSEIRAFTDDEIVEIKKVATMLFKNKKPIYSLGYGYIFMLNTGIRLGEALALKWNDIDFDKNILNIRRNAVMAVDRKSNSKKRVYTEQETAKTTAGNRKIPLNDGAIYALNELKKIRYFGQDSYVMSTEYNKPNKVRNFCRTYETIIEKAKVEHSGIHTLRHTFASKLFRAGVDVKTVSELLGHSSTQVTYNTYIHLIQEQKVAAVKIIDNI